MAKISVEHALDKFITTAVLLAILLITGHESMASDTAGLTHQYFWSLGTSPKYMENEKNLHYVDTRARKGGVLQLGTIGHFQNLNVYNAEDIRASARLEVLTVQSLMSTPYDDPLLQYGLIAQSLEFPADLGWVLFHIRKEAKWHDNTPITPEDVIFSLVALKSYGNPMVKLSLAEITSAEKVSDCGVKFNFSTKNNRELPWLAGQMPILAAKYWENRDFTAKTIEPFLTSGPYKIVEVKTGLDNSGPPQIVYQRVLNYWAEKVMFTPGRYNFLRIIEKYYPDHPTMFLAFQAGEYDFRDELVTQNVNTIYNFPAYKAGKVKLQDMDHYRPQGMQGYVFNLRKSQFLDLKVRMALTYAFDFEWINKNIFNNRYFRCESFFNNSELAARHLPSAKEYSLLEPYKEKLPPEIFSQPYRAPFNPDIAAYSGNLQRAAELLEEAGYKIIEGTLVDDKTKMPFHLRVTIPQLRGMEQPTLAYIRSLKRIGIDATMVPLAPDEFGNVLSKFDYDMIVYTFTQSESPGYEQRGYWNSQYANVPKSQNIIGLNDAVIDDLVERVASANDRESLLTAVHALDRVLLWGFYVVPQWYSKSDRIAYWDKFTRPSTQPFPLVKYDIFSWWVDKDADSQLSAYRRKEGLARGF